jgi:hypothetical protein
LARLGYAAAVDAADLTVPTSCGEPEALRLLVAAGIGPVRLIDNCAALRPSELARRGRGRHNLPAAAPAS